MAIKIKEVRIGNYISEWDLITTIQLSDFDCVDHWRGIPITKKWCEKLGFQIQERFHSTSNYDWVAKKDMIKIMSLDGETDVFFIMGGVSTLKDNIKYVHQLQNLYFAWNLEELTVDK